MTSFMDEASYEKHLDVLSNVNLLAADTETTGFGVADGSDYLQGISTACRVDGLGLISCYFPFRHETDNLPERFRTRLTNILENKTTIYHNLTFDLLSLDTFGIKPTGRLFCTMTMAHMINENWFSKSLDALSKMLLKKEKAKKPIDTWSKIFGWGTIPASIMAPYACVDAELAYELMEVLWPMMKKQNLDGLWDIELEWIRLLANLKKQGVCTNLNFCREKTNYGLFVMNDLRMTLGFNPSSDKDLNDYLINHLQLPVVKTTPTGRPSFDKSAMARYDELLEVNDRKEAQMVLTYRGWQKAVSSLYEPMLRLTSSNTGRVHPDFKVHGTRTGRLSCEKPNLQQIPRSGSKEWNGDAKKAFVAPDGFTLIEFDYSQLEFRLATAYGKDAVLLNAFNNDEDVFIPIAIQIFGGAEFRQDAKTLVYTTLYGGGIRRLMEVFRKSEDEARAIYTNFRESYPGIYEKSKLAARNVERNGYVRYWTGRKRHLTKDESHKAFNAACQGGAAEIVKRSGLRVQKEVCDENRKMVLTVHDSWVLEIRNDLVEDTIPVVKKLMTDWDFGVKLAVDAHVWGEG